MGATEHVEKLSCVILPSQGFMAYESLFLVIGSECVSLRNLSGIHFGKNIAVKLFPDHS